MQATIEVDDELMARAMQETGDSSQDAVIEAGLRLLLQMRAQSRLRQLRGEVSWEGDLDALRQDRTGA